MRKVTVDYLNHTNKLLTPENLAIRYHSRCLVAPHQQDYVEIHYLADNPLNTDFRPNL